jgi:hypothetical protein
MICRKNILYISQDTEFSQSLFFTLGGLIISPFFFAGSIDNSSVNHRVRRCSSARKIFYRTIKKKLDVEFNTTHALSSKG